MIVCICNNVSESEVQKLLEKSGASSLDEFLVGVNSICNQCRCCADYISMLIEEKNNEHEQKGHSTNCRCSN
ncbi:hypothetical protein RsoM2USA_475 [Ralstonia phage RsoM2USA]|nr:hypothetical protein RsoM2USA_475 [Ralstonia phage RsoM2USA]